MAMESESRCESSSSSYACPLCQGFIVRTYKLWLSHLRHVHSHDANFHVVCGVDSCPRSFRVFSTLYSHVYRSHRHMLNSRDRMPTDVEYVSPDEQATTSSALPTEHLSMDATYDSTSADIARLMGIDRDGVRQQAALFLLKMKEKRFLTQSAIDDLVEETGSIFDRTLSMFRAGIREKVAAAGVDPASLQLDRIFDELRLTDPFDGLKTKHYQEKYFREDLQLIEPQEIEVGEPYETYQFTGPKRKCVRRYDTYYYVPLLKSLQRLLNDCTVLEEVENCSHRIRTDNMLEDFCDGSVFSENALFMSDPKALQIVAYYDELEVVNPLGAYVKKHKVGVVLFSLGNVHPKLRSRLRAINLVLVCQVELIEKYGINEILKPFVRDLNILSSNGIVVSAQGVNSTLKGALLTFLADTQASQLLGGFKNSVSAFRMCRTCMATSSTFKVKFSSNNFQLRTTTSHKSHCDKLSGSLSDHYSKVYGVNRRSVLLDVKDYTMLDWGLPHDAMHDLFEGVVQYEIKLVLSHCCKAKYFSLQQFNQWLLNFDYGHSEVADKPTPITSAHLHADSKHLRQGAAQTWLLARILPLLIARHIPASDKVWQCFIKLLKIIDICVAPVLSADTCGVLKILIEEHHQIFTQIHPEWSVIPKMHFMIHYPEQIMALGPLVRSWTMRHEAKLYLLKCAGRISNFKNISQSISYRHQRLMCYELASGGLLHPNIECGPSNSALARSLRNETTCIRDHIHSLVPDISDDVIISRSSWVKICGLTYKSTSTYVLWKIGNAELAEPTLWFGCIDEILVASSTLILFLVCVYRSNYFDDHYHAYVVHRTSERAVVSYTDLLDHTVYHCREICGKSYIVMKYYIH